MAKVSILLPTYNSISRNGDGLLQAALTSLLNQTSNDFELHILDNISTDNTPEICQEFAKNDSRIDFRIDTQQRSSEEGITELAKEVDTEYLMIANCDNLWNHYYIESLLKIIETQTELALVYSNGTFLSTDNKMGDTLLQDTSFTYNHSMKHNFCLTIQHRTVVPLLFGIFRTKPYQDTLPYIKFDTLNTNIDNLFLARFFLNGNKAQLCNKSLFHYRDRPRDLNQETVDDMPTNPILVWTYYIRHQLNFYKAVARYIPTGQPLMNIATLDSCFKYLFPLLAWVTRDLPRDMFEESILQIIYRKYSMILPLLFKSSYPQLDHTLYDNHYKKCNTLSQHVLPYINTILSPDPLIDNTAALIKEIQAETL